jgi:hypothetical protein
VLWSSDRSDIAHRCLRCSRARHGLAEKPLNDCMYLDQQPRMSMRCMVWNFNGLGSLLYVARCALVACLLLTNIQRALKTTSRRIISAFSKTWFCPES